MQRVKQVQRKRKESEIRKRSVFFTDGQKWLSFCRLLQSFVFVYRAQKREFTLKLFIDWFGSYFIAALMYSQFMFTISRKIYRLLQPTYQATSFQGGLTLVSSFKSLVNFCREIQEISFHSPKVFLPKLQTTSAPSCFELCRVGKEPMEPVFCVLRLHLRLRFPDSHV